MAVPTLVGVANEFVNHATGAVDKGALIAGGIVPGDMVYYFAVHDANGGINYSRNATEGWETLYSPTVLNTRVYYLARKEYVSGTTMPIRFDTTQSGQFAYVTVVVRGGDAANTLMGDYWFRPASTDQRTIAQGLSVAEDVLAIGFHGEASGTNASVEGGVVGSSGGTIIDIGDHQDADWSRINQTIITSSEHTGDSSTVDHVVNYEGTTPNGFALQVAIPTLSDTPVLDEQVKHASCPYFTEDTIRVSVRVDDASLTHTVSDGTDEKTLVVDPTTQWGYADFTGLNPGTEYTYSFESDSVAQSYGSVTYRTMPSGPASFVFAAGSCQFTASNHPVFENIEQDNALFLAHMGDLHYEDSTIEAGWRGGVNASMGSERMRSMLGSVPMTWQWDNHDRIIIDTLNLGETDPETLSSYRTYAGATGWDVATANCRTWAAGRVRFIDTDHWTERDDPDLVPTPVMWSPEQLQWWKDTLEDAQEPVIVWFSQWTNQNNANGRWNSFDEQTTELEDWLNARPGIKQRLVMIGGDSHSLQADSGTRTGSHRFNGIPNLCISGFNRASWYDNETTSWDVADLSLLANASQPEQEVGGYSRVTVDDDGTNITFKWEAVRVQDTGAVDIMAEYTRTTGTVVVNGNDCILTMYDVGESRHKQVSVEFADI